MTDFKEFAKITRFYEQDVVITEKIDGTNGLIFIPEDGLYVRAGSRSRWIDITDDNYGFAKWVDENVPELAKLGPGYHYGEWWGQGIQRKYSMAKKVFSLFNSHRWADESIRPSCCDVVPVLYSGPVTPAIVAHYSQPLTKSAAALKYGIEFNKPEGVMLYFTKANAYFKVPHDKEKEKSKEQIRKRPAYPKVQDAGCCGQKEEAE